MGGQEMDKPEGGDVWAGHVHMCASQIQMGSVKRSGHELCNAQSGR